ncbi:MAG: NUDIX hydrolase [Bacilli bacterium]|nr:NUDIX hydrolase [Bacillales bacterium]MDY2574634.1 NUDIX hydrolase [Bacilli bacterium]
MINLYLNDDQYPNNGINHIRKVARGILFNDKNEICILKIYGEDIFGIRDYYETPGGGVDDNESFEEAVLRELDEEVGVKSHIIAFVGEIEDYYNLIFRKNINRYFICKIDEITRIHHVSEGDSMIKDLLFVPLEEAISLYEKMSDYGVSKLVKQRELPILKEVKRMIDKKIMQIS